jgi:hypothetical protein
MLFVLVDGRNGIQRAALSRIVDVYNSRVACRGPRDAD